MAADWNYQALEGPAGQLELGLLPQLIEMRTVEEDWSGMSAPAARRRLQNRLNQRARRKRAQKGSGSAAGSIESEKRPNKPETCLQSPKQADVQCGLRTDASRRELLNFADGALQRYSMGIVSLVHLPDVLRFNIFYALAKNALSLSLSNDWLKYEATSSFNVRSLPIVEEAIAEYPPSLRPTILQYTVEHHPWIDLLPCPRLRDNFLGIVKKLGDDGIDEDKLCHDIVDASMKDQDSNAALIVWGDPWEITSWEVTEAFAEDWGNLLHGCDELLRSTHMWREKRGLAPLARCGRSSLLDDGCRSTLT